MKQFYASRKFLICSTAVLASALTVAGCKDKTHPDEKKAVTTSLSSNNLSQVDVSQDREKGIMTLTGNVEAQDLKTQAENIAKQAAPDYTIADEIGVRPPENSDAGSAASKRDSAIEDNFKALLKDHKNLNDQSISVSAKNGTVELKGSVKTAAQKREAGNLAKGIQNVQQVVNEIEVKPSKHSTANS
jgi:hyperosmotically inducible periplasmic protein